MSGADLHLIGMVTDTPMLVIEDGYDTIIETGVDDLTHSWKHALDMTGDVE